MNIVDIIVTVLVSSIGGYVVYLIMSKVPPVAKFADVGGIVVFLLILLSRAGEI
jgi:hypothetical protein